MRSQKGDDTVNPTIETVRLVYEPLAAKHVDAYRALIAQPEVHRYLSRAADIAADPEGQAARIVGVSEQQWRERSYGPFAIFEKGSRQLIGRGGLFWIQSLGQVEINYMFEPSVWGRGYATEAASAFLDFGFGQHGLQVMVATTNPSNAASAHVLQKVGMSRAGTKDLGGCRISDYYEISRATWLSRREAR
jgi:RimJ/RimL family protein N-acetyltransferase